MRQIGTQKDDCQGMSGGAWGSALVLSTGQAAVEILPTPTNANARHIVTVVGTPYDSSVGLNCKSSQGSGEAHDVIGKTRRALCTAETRAKRDA